MAYLTDEAGNAYPVGEERPAFLTFLPYWDNIYTQYLDAEGNPLWLPLCINLKSLCMGIMHNL